jgi:hypothetical protein
VPPTCGKFSIPKQPQVAKIPEVNPGNTGEQEDNSLIVEASDNALLQEVQIDGKIHQFLFDSGASLSLVKPGVRQAEVRPTDLSAREIIGAKLKSIGTQEIEIKLGNRAYTHKFLVTLLDVEYNEVLGLDNFRQM